MVWGKGKIFLPVISLTEHTPAPPDRGFTVFPGPHEAERGRRVHQVYDEAQAAALVQLRKPGADQRVHSAWRAAGVPLRRGDGEVRYGRMY